MKVIKILIIAAVCLCAAFSTAFAQDPPNPSVRIQLAPAFEAGLQSVYLSDLGFLTKSATDYLFDVSLHDILEEWTGVTLILQILQGEDVVLEFQANDIELVSNPALADPRTGEPDWQANNVELLTLETFPGSGITLTWNKTYSAPNDDFETYFGQTGQVQRGTYFFKAILRHAEWESESAIRFEITNPSTIQLRAPANYEVVTTEFPFFQYDSDAVEYLVQLYKQTGERDDIETILAGRPAMEYNTNLKQFSYNMTDGDPLESGVTYFWNVTAYVYSSHGREEFKSPVWQFTLNTELTPISWLDLKTLLEPLVGQQAEQIADNLANFQLGIIQLNGEVITLQQLYEAIDAYRTKNFDVLEVELQ